MEHTEKKDLRGNTCSLCVIRVGWIWTFDSFKIKLQETSGSHSNLWVSAIHKVHKVQLQVKYSLLLNARTEHGCWLPIKIPADITLDSNWVFSSPQTLILHEFVSAACSTLVYHALQAYSMCEGAKDVDTKSERFKFSVVPWSLWTMPVTAALWSAFRFVCHVRSEWV